MTPEHTRDGESSSGVTPGADGGARPDPSPTRRGLLVGVGLAGLGGALAGCSTAAVPYGANEAGAVPGGQGMAGPASQGQGAMASSGTASSGTMSGPGGGLQASPSPSHSRQNGGQNGSSQNGSAEGGAAKKSAKLTGTVLGAASEVPVGGGKIYTAAKVVVTQPARGQYKAFSAVCTHVGCIMSEVANGTIDCPCHGGQFKITNGAVVAGPPPSPLPARPVKVVNGQVVLL
jgi:Rieske Fe-S protein